MKVEFKTWVEIDDDTNIRELLVKIKHNLMVDRGTFYLVDVTWEFINNVELSGEGK